MSWFRTLRLFGISQSSGANRAADQLRDLKGMLAVDGSEDMAKLGAVFAGRPSGSVWTQPEGVFNEG